MNESGRDRSRAIAWLVLTVLVLPSGGLAGDTRDPDMSLQADREAFWKSFLSRQGTDKIKQNSDGGMDGHVEASLNELQETVDRDLGSVGATFVDREWVEVERTTDQRSGFVRFFWYGYVDSGVLRTSQGSFFIEGNENKKKEKARPHRRLIGVVFAPPAQSCLADKPTVPPPAAGSSIKAVTVDQTADADYPELARVARLEATVSVQLVIDENGQIRDACATATRPNLEFEEHALDAIRQWRFEPATVDGETVSSIIDIPMRFMLN